MAPDQEISIQVHEAFNAGDTEAFRRLLAAHPAFLRHEDGTDRWMWQAAINGNLPMVQALADLGMSVNEPRNHLEPDDDGQFCQVEGPIVQAATEGHLHVVRWLLEHGAKINYVVAGRTRCLPLQFAATRGHLDVVKLLVERGAEINAAENGTNAITQAEAYGHLDVRDYLRSHGARTVREMVGEDSASRRSDVL